MTIHTSEELFRLAKEIIPGGVNSPVRAFKAVGGTPIFFEKAKGAYLYDYDHNQYIDYVGSWGPMILGHAHPTVIKTVQETAEQGLSFGAPTALEIKLAEKICSLMPNIEKIRMVNSGTEATMSAIRLARGYTKKSKLIKFAGCYHGHADCLLVKSGSGALTFGHPNSAGVTSGAAQDTLIATYNDIDSVTTLFEQNPNDIAAIIIEPFAGNMNFIRPKSDFLWNLRQLCDQYQSLLIFDEVMTGFRVALGGAQAIYDVVPDLTTLGKVIGGGMPVGAFGGKREIMDSLSPLGSVYQAGTLSGNPIAMAAGLKTLELIEQSHFFSHLHQISGELMHGLNELAKKYGIDLFTDYEGGMFGFFFSANAIYNLADAEKCHIDQFKQFFHLMLDKGIYLASSAFEAGFVSSAHTAQDIATTLEAAEASFKIMKK